MAGEETSVPVVAVTAAVGAVVLLIVFLCSVGKKTQDEKEEPGKKEKESFLENFDSLFSRSPQNENVYRLYFSFLLSIHEFKF